MWAAARAQVQSRCRHAAAEGPRPRAGRIIDANLRSIGRNKNIREEDMRRIVLASLLGAALPFAASAQTADEIKNAAKTPQNVLTYGMSYSQQRFSPLTQINRDTVKRLVPAWSYSMNNNTGEESQPLIYDGVMYVTSQNKT